MSDSDEKYASFLAGDAKSLFALIEEYHMRLSLYLNLVLGDICDAQDAVQETFARLYFKKPRISGGVGFKAWLYGFARRCAEDFANYGKLLSMNYMDEKVSDDDEELLVSSVLGDGEAAKLYYDLKSSSGEPAQMCYLTQIEGFTPRETEFIMKRRMSVIGETEEPAAEEDE